MTPNLSSSPNSFLGEQRHYGWKETWPRRQQSDSARAWTQTSRRSVKSARLSPVLNFFLIEKSNWWKTELNQS